MRGTFEEIQFFNVDNIKYFINWLSFIQVFSSEVISMAILKVKTLEKLLDLKYNTTVSGSRELELLKNQISNPPPTITGKAIQIWSWWDYPFSSDLTDPNFSYQLFQNLHYKLLTDPTYIQTIPNLTSLFLFVAHQKFPSSSNPT